MNACTPTPNRALQWQRLCVCFELSNKISIGFYQMSIKRTQKNEQTGEKKVSIISRWKLISCDKTMMLYPGNTTKKSINLYWMHRYKEQEKTYKHKHSYNTCTLIFISASLSTLLTISDIRLSITLIFGSMCFLFYLQFSHFRYFIVAVASVKSWAILMQSYILLSLQCRSRRSYNWLSALKFCVRVIRTWLSIFNDSRDNSMCSAIIFAISFILLFTLSLCCAKKKYPQ